MTTPKLRSKKARRRTNANNTEKRSVQDTSTDDDGTTKSQKTRERSRLNFSDEVKSAPENRGFSGEQERDRDYDSEVESPHRSVGENALLDPYASEDLRTDLGGKKASVPQGRSQPNQK